MNRPFLFFAAIAFFGAGCGAAPNPDIPSPEDHFGYAPGAEGELANWDELTAYYDRLAETSGRVTVDTVGTSTRGQPFVMMTITSQENHRDLERLRETNLRIQDPRTISGADELESRLHEGRTVVLVTNHIHSTEVASGQMPPRTAYRLATSNDPAVLEILDEVIVLMVPSLNPDGTQWTSDWWREWRGTEYEGAPLPFLYHYYVGHNNNRDWYPLIQQETRLAVEHAHNAWRPHIVHDIHQMGPTGARYFVPPYIDPIDPNTDPKLVTALNQLGAYMAAEMTAEGKQGIVVNAIFDLYTPARAYQHYHGGVRILSETAQADWANTRVVDPDELGPGREYHAGERSWKFPDPWPGGEWSLEDAVDYMDAGVMALLRNAAKNRRFWLENAHAVMGRAVGGWEEWPAAWVIPAEQENEMGLAELLRILTMGDVEVHRAESSFTAGVDFPAGSYVIPMNQPHGSFAHTLLEQPEYPDLREYPGGPPQRPYDATSWNLPLLLDVEAHRAEEPVDVALSDPLPVTESQYEAPEALLGPEAPRIAYYKGYRELREAGWTRWLFDQTGIEYDTLHHHDVRAGGLDERYDVILFQDQPGDHLMDGWPEDVMPEPYHGGIGEEGMAALRTFVEGGGRVVAVEQATDFVVETFDLGVSNVLAGLDPEDFYIPGSILELTFDQGSDLGEGMDSEGVAWFWSAEARELSRAFRIDDPGITVAARYGEVLSGWALGPEHVADQPALVEASVGEGSVVLFGFQPNYRGHSMATWPLLFNSLSVPRRP